MADYKGKLTGKQIDELPDKVNELSQKVGQIEGNQTTVKEIEEVMQTLSDGSAVTAQVAVNAGKLSELETEVKGLTADGEPIEYNVSEIEEHGGVINDVTNIWYTTNPAQYSHTIIELNPNTDCELRTGATSGHYALLKTYNPVNGTVVDYCDGETYKTMGTRQTYQFVSPPDCHYLYLGRMSSGKKQSIEKVTLPKKKGIITEIEEKVEQSTMSVNLMQEDGNVVLVATTTNGNVEKSIMPSATETSAGAMSAKQVETLTETSNAMKSLFGEEIVFNDYVLGKYLLIDGKRESSSDLTRGYCNDYIKIENGCEYALNNKGYKLCLYFYDKDKILTKQDHWFDANVNSFVAPNDGYVRLSFQSHDNSVLSSYDPITISVDGQIEKLSNEVNKISEQVADINDRVTELESKEGVPSSNACGGDCYLVAKEIKENRPYFLNDSFNDELSYADTSYLDEKIRNVPKGKHFIFSTDSHINYNDVRRTQQAVGLTQKETEIMLYVKKKLNITPVVFGGDIIGKANSAYQGAKIVSIFCEDKFNAFGQDFIFCMGNHDCNHVGGLSSEYWVSDEEIYKRTTGVMARYGIAKFDEEGIEAVDHIGLSLGDSSALKAWMKLHYLWDDDKNKVRYIILESGDYSYAADMILGVGGAGSYLIWTYIDWVIEAFASCPDAYDIVVVEHELCAKTDFSGGVYTPKWKGTNLLLDLISKFNRRMSFSSDGQDMSSFPNIEKMRKYRNSASLYTTDFSQRTKGRAFIISGHYHFDDAWLIQKSSNEGIAKYSGVEYATNPTRKDDCVLAIQTDRSMINAMGENYESYAPNAVTVEDDQYEQRWGTKNEVLFDIVTITEDGRVVCTRIGGGNDREFTL